MYRAPPYQPLAYFALFVLILSIFELAGTTEAGHARFFAVSGTLAALFTVAAAVYLAVSRVLDRITVYATRRLNYILLDAAVYIAVALGVLAVDCGLLGSPLSEAADIAVGVVILGYFATIDNALARQLNWFNNNQITVSRQFRVFPMAYKFSLILTVTLLIIAVAVTLLSVHQLAGGFGEQGEQGFIVALVLLFGTILGLLLRLIHAYTRNLHAFLQAQMDILRSVQEGDFNCRAPIMSQDELGMVAVQINTMVENLRDRLHIQKTLERVVGANIMEKLLTTDGETLKRGKKEEVAIMFCDMRDFTSMSEAASSEEIILFLNSFFADLSEIVDSHNGIINKFMGDAILAVFGLEVGGNPVDNAVRSSLDILAHTRSFVLPDGSHPDMGAGIHFGTVVGGTIGSEDRYEYTFLGDAVNTASRLEGLTKRLHYRIVISSAAAAELSEEILKSFEDLGDQRVRGKAEAIRVFGRDHKQPQDDN